MFENNLKFRKDNKIDTILQDFEFPEKDEVLNHYQNSWFGCDKIGRPFFIDRIGAINIKGCLQVSTDERIFRWVYHEWEKTLKLRFSACSILFDR